MTDSINDRLPPQSLQVVEAEVAELKRSALAALVSASDMLDVARAQGAIKCLTDLVSRLKR